MKRFDTNIVIKPSNTRGGTSSQARFEPASLLPTGMSPKPSEGSDQLDQLTFPANNRNSMAVNSSKGLTNHPGENNCFMNCPVQILWHLNTFRRNFRLLVAHACTGDQCIFCSLKYIYTTYQFSDQPILSSDVLRQSMAFTFSFQQKFQLGSMDDASECYETILDCLHDHLVPTPDGDDDGKSGDDDDDDTLCTAPHCLTHRKMSLLINEQTVCSCGSKSQPLNSFHPVFYVSTSSVLNQIRIKKNSGLSFAKKLYKARGQGSHRTCHDHKCNRQAHQVQTLLNDPEVLTIGFVWDAHEPQHGHVIDIVSSIQYHVTARELFHESTSVLTSSLELSGLLCYRNKHYCVFLLHPKQKVWFLYNDDCITRLDEKWETVKEKCCKDKLQPLLLLYANNKATTPIDTSTTLRATYIRTTNRDRSDTTKTKTSATTTSKQSATSCDRRGDELSRTKRRARRQSYQEAVCDVDKDDTRLSFIDPNIYHPSRSSSQSSITSSNYSSSHSSVNLSQATETNFDINRKKSVRFRREVEGSTTSGEIVFSHLNGPVDEKVVSVPHKNLSQPPPKQGIRKITSSGEVTFSKISSEFLKLSRVEEEASEVADEYIDSNLVNNILAKTRPRKQPNKYSSAMCIYPKIIEQRPGNYRAGDSQDVISCSKPSMFDSSKQINDVSNSKKFTNSEPVSTFKRGSFV